MSKIKLRPLDDRVVVKPQEAEETTAGGIVLPDSAKEKPQRGEVVAVGPGKLLDKRSRSFVKAIFLRKYWRNSSLDVAFVGRDGSENHSQTFS